MRLSYNKKVKWFFRRVVRPHPDCLRLEMLIELHIGIPIFSWNIGGVTGSDAGTYDLCKMSRVGGPLGVEKQYPRLWTNTEFFSGCPKILVPHQGY